MVIKASRNLSIAASRDIPSRLKLTGTLAIAAAEAAAEGEKPKQRKMKLVANSGRPMKLGGFFDPVIVDLAGAYFQKERTAVIYEHDTTLRLGYTTGQAVAAKNITAEALLTSRSQVAADFAQDYDDGIPFEVSIGADIEAAEYLEPGAKAKVNGRNVTGPLIIARKTAIRELSVALVGADAGTSVKLAASRKEISEMNFADWVLATFGIEASKLKADQVKKFKAQYKAMQASGEIEDVDDDDDVDEDDADDAPVSRRKPAKVRARRTAPADGDDDRLEASRQREADEIERRDSIRATFDEYEDVKDVTLEDGKTKLTAAKLRAKAIRDGWTVDRVEVLLLRASRDTGPAGAPAIHVATKVEGELQAQAMAIAICRTFNATANGEIKGTGRKYGYEVGVDQKVLEAADQRQFRGLGLHQLMDMNIEAAGMHFRGNRKSNDYIRTFLRANARILADGAGAISTLAVTSILENVANKILLAAYEAQEVAYPFICGIKSLTDFKPHNFYRLTVNGGYVKVPPTGQLSTGQFSDQKFTVQGDTYGMILGLDRRDIWNDDLNAFEIIPTAVGREAALAIEEAAHELLLDGSICSVGNNNIIDADMNIAGITLAETFWRDYVDAKGKPIMVSPDRLLVGNQDVVPARDIFGSRALLATAVTTSGSPVVSTAENPHAGKYRPIPSAMLSNTAIRKQDGSRFTNVDSKQFFMFCDPTKLPSILLGFVGGQRNPYFEQSETSFDRLGMEWRSWGDWGVGAGDPKGVLKCSGDEPSN